MHPIVASLADGKRNNLRRVLSYDLTDRTPIPCIIAMPKSRIDDEVFKSQVIKYLRNTEFKRLSVLDRPAYTNPFTGLPMDANGCQFSDGVWSWGDSLMIFVRDHDIALPTEFLDHIRAFYADGGTVRKTTSLFPQYD